MSGPVQPTTFASAGAVAIASDRVVAGRYQIVTTIASGGMGSVYLAVDLSLSRQVALKTLDRDLEQQSAWGRFEREANNLSRLNHPNIARIYDFGKLDNLVPYLVMELVHGQSLSERLRLRGPLSSAEALCVFQCIAAALDYAHQFNIVHRDIKPGNIVLITDQLGAIKGAKLIDFGLAKSLDDGIFGQGLTATGEILGSPFYMSPEQWNSERLMPPSDIYSLGVSLFEALTNRLPYRGDNVFATAMLHAKSDIPELARYNTDIDRVESWQKIIDKMLGKAAEERYASAALLSQDLRRLSRNDFIEDFEEVEVEDYCCHGGDKKDSNGPCDICGARLKSGFAMSKLFWTAACLLCIVLTALVSLFMSAPHRAHAVTVKQAAAPPHLLSIPLMRKSIEVAHYSMSSHIDKHGFKVINLPNPEALGGFQIPTGMVAAVGELKFAPGTEVDFYPNELFLLNPKLFQTVGHNILTQLHIQGCPVDFNDESFKLIGDMTGLTTVEVRNCSITANSVEILNRLPKLKHLILVDTEIRGSDLLKLNRLKQLESFNGCDFTNVRPVLKALGSNYNLHGLTLKADNIVDSDLKTIAAIPNLRDLNISCNAGLTAQGIANLAVCKNLRRLHIDHMSLNPAAVKALSRLQSLQVLNIDWHECTPVERVMLENALPHCRIN